MTAPPETPAAALAAIRERIARAAERAGRDPATVTLIAVTKTQPITRIAEAIALGVRDFGENRVQEALAKFAPPGGPAGGAHSPDGEALIPRTGLTLHLIGTLQRNKARRAAAFFDTIQSVDRLDLVADLERHRAMDAPDRPPLPVLIEVNISGEAAKTGAAPADVPALVDALRACPHLAPRGLMTIAAPGLDEAALRRQFAAVRELRDRLQAEHPDVAWSELSMGMSDDFEAAILEGATMVRLGRALFGEQH
ncbi:MAG TPA: YggS family pyridoxal phosphate-dependent enzyme [Chloroflexia bacterium]|nr:YggS family pyridoxal phosphate-dependent enzyme [Chloroflexia bacterium]